jgi:acetyl esterase/lipase
MLDDRNTTPGAVPPGVLTWTYDSNYTGWHCLLGDEIGGDRVPPVAAPGRLTDFTRLAPAYIEVGDLDIFRDESIAYAAALSKAAVPVELHVHPGAPTASSAWSRTPATHDVPWPTGPAQSPPSSCVRTRDRR